MKKMKSDFNETNKSQWFRSFSNFNEPLKNNERQALSANRFSLRSHHRTAHKNETDILIRWKKLKFSKRRRFLLRRQRENSNWKSVQTMRWDDANVTRKGKNIHLHTQATDRGTVEHNQNDTIYFTNSNRIFVQYSIFQFTNRTILMSSKLRRRVIEQLRLKWRRAHNLDVVRSRSTVRCRQLNINLKSISF